MITPQELRAAMATADEEALRELETAIDATLKKNWVDKNSQVVFNVVKTYPRRVLDQMIDKYKRKGWTVWRYLGASSEEDAFTFSEDPAAPSTVCRCPPDMHVCGCDRNPE